MKTVETIATVTADGQVTFPAPPGVTLGKHRVRVEISDDIIGEPEHPKPKSYRNGRPVYDEEDMKQMKPDLPPETEWAKELKIE